MNNIVLKVENLKTNFMMKRGIVKAVDGVDFSIRRGEKMALVGESGCGKTVTALSIMKLIYHPGKIAEGKISLVGEDLLAKSEREMREIRGSKLGMVFQDPTSSLNPSLSVGEQIAETIMAHSGAGYRAALSRSIELMESVGVSPASARIRDYPHQFSGGMRQRIMLAAAISMNPTLLIADEPTTALDVITQRQILSLFKELTRRYGMSLLFITHDLGIVSELCDSVSVMSAGKIVEHASVEDLFEKPSHPYTRALLKCIPKLGEHVTQSETIKDRVPDMSENKDELLNVLNLKKYFPVKQTLVEQLIEKEKRFVFAIDDVTLTIRKGEIVGLVGESGCGKSTLGKTILRLYHPTGGRIIFEGMDITDMSERQLRSLRPRMQIVFQNPYTSLNPRKTIRQILTRALMMRGNIANIEDELEKLVISIGLDTECLRLYPHQFSGGQRQRIALARALALEPDIIVADEPVASLDVSMQAQIITLMKNLQKKFSLAVLFISHDINIVCYLSHTVAVMYLGKIAEIGSSRDIANDPCHPYTQALISAVPLIAKSEKKEIVLTGDIPTPINPPGGCRFRTRCYFKKKDICYQQHPELRNVKEGRLAACHLI